LRPAPAQSTFPIDYFLADDQGHVSRGEIRAETIDVRRVNFPPGLSALKLSVKSNDSDQNTGHHFRSLRSWMEFEISDIVLNAGK
jgi:hypothetical protein